MQAGPGQVNRIPRLGRPGRAGRRLTGAAAPLTVAASAARLRFALISGPDMSDLAAAQTRLAAALDRLEAAGGPAADALKTLAALGDADPAELAAANRALEAERDALAERLAAVEQELARLRRSTVKEIDAALADLDAALDADGRG